jgi:Pyruvate/2-oxoacid:ferredoxin oxidoreductase delta subunit
MTGTGNTWRAAAAISEELSAKGWTVNMVELRKGAESPKGDFAGDLFVLSFPVLAFGIPAMVRTVLRGLRGRGSDAVVFATWGGAATASLWQAAGFLRRKGFRVVATGGAAYPFNWTQMLAPSDAASSRSMTREGDAEARRFANAVSGSTARAGEARRFADAVHGAVAGGHGEKASVRRTRAASIIGGVPVAWLYSTIGRFGLAALFAADERCTACGACARECPARAIVMAGKGESRRPQWRTRCQGCNRCINMCPGAAIQSSPVRASVHLTVNVVLIVLSVIGLNRLSALAGLPPYLSIPAWIVAFVLLVVYLSRLQFTALEPLLFALEGMPGLRKRIGRSWTAGFGRNSAEGFTGRAGKQAGKKISGRRR